MPKSHPFSRWPDNLPPLETAEKLRAERDELLETVERLHRGLPSKEQRDHCAALIARIKEAK